MHPEADPRSHCLKSCPYAAGDFGFTDQDVRHAFADYIEWVAAENICDWSF